MKVLFFTGSETKKSQQDSYGGGGWMYSLMNELEKFESVVLANSFFYDMDVEPWMKGSIKNYPMFKNPRTKFKKLYYNWIGYKKVTYNEDVPLMLKVIDDFKPDIIHIFGTEKSFSAVQNYTKVPVIIYLQGILNPYYNAFFPPGVNKWSFLISSFSKNEWILNNGYYANYKNMKLEANREIIHFKNARFVIGRTTWDYEISRLLSPTSQYFILNDMLRPEFYNAKPWDKKKENNYIIYSTISNVSYKGLDVILKTAKLLKDYSSLQFEWRVVGIYPHNQIISFFEKLLSIKSTDVSIKYLGVCTVDQLISNLQHADVYVHPSHIENAPNSLCEAQMLGVPVIATNVGGVCNLVSNGKTGILVPPNAPYELAFFIKESAEKNNLKQLAVNARAEAFKRHDKDQIVNDLINIYKGILNGRTKSKAVNYMSVEY